MTLLTPLTAMTEGSARSIRSQNQGDPISPGRIEGHGKRGKALIADYVLEYRNRKLAVNEAKAWRNSIRRNSRRCSCSNTTTPLRMPWQTLAASPK